MRLSVIEPTRNVTIDCPEEVCAFSCDLVQVHTHFRVKAHILAQSLGPGVCSPLLPRAYSHQMARVTLNVNGSAHAVEVDADTRLLWVLRESLDLTGAKYGCGEGQCGACTVLVDGKPIQSCMARATALAGRRIETIESLSADGKLHRVQQAFLDQDAMQCGYCTPGMIMAAMSLLRTNPSPSDAAIVQAMDRHLCRCGTYPRIVAAIRQAADKPSENTR
jgi:isoquinoline 1-oxidoreductase subunit alpha